MPSIDPRLSHAAQPVYMLNISSCLWPGILLRTAVSGVGSLRSADQILRFIYVRANVHNHPDLDVLQVFLFQSTEIGREPHVDEGMYTQQTRRADGSVKRH